MIKNSTLLLLFAVTGFSGLCSSAEDEEASRPSLQVELKRMILRSEDKKVVGKPEWEMELRWMMSDVPGWEIYCCEDEPSRVTVEDSTGKKSADVECVSMKMAGRIGGCVRPRGWMPASGARWVSVKGELPFVVSRRESVTAPVVVKLAEGASAPLILKGAALGKDGRAEDVKAKLVVKEYRDSNPYESEGRKDQKILRLHVEADVPVGIRDFIFQTVDGMPVAAGDFDQRMRELMGVQMLADLHLSIRNRPWQMKTKGWGSGMVEGRWEISSVPEGELLVSVRYSQNLRRCRARLDGKASLAGFFPEGAAHDGKSFETESLPRNAASVPFPASCARGGKGKPPVTVRFSSMTLGSGNEWEDGSDPVQINFGMELAAKAPAVFGDRADMKEQSLAVTDSTGHALAPAVFNLEWLDTWNQEKKSVSVSIGGNILETASPGAEWLRLQGMLRVPLAVLRESPVYELPLQEGAELQIPLPGMEDAGGNGLDVAALGEAPSGCLKLKDVKNMEEGEKQAESGMKVELSLTVKGFSFDLDCFELVDGNGAPLKEVESCGNGRSRSIDAQGREKERSWSQNFRIGSATDLKNLHVRLKYKANAETVDVPVDGRIGLGGPEGRTPSVTRP